MNLSEPASHCTHPTTFLDLLPIYHVLPYCLKTLSQKQGMALSLPTHHDESAVAAGDVDLSHLDLDDLVGVAHDEKAARLAAADRARARPELVLALAGAHRHAFWKGK